MQTVLHQLARLLTREATAGLADHQLLELYRTRRDEEAFAALVARHGPMVLGVCRRTLTNEQDVEDAFQATFLVLAHRAGEIRKEASLGSWLHGVAARLSRQARRTTTRRLRHERDLASLALPAGEPPCAEALQALDEELERLPESLRAPLVLCYLAGQSQQQAARQLGLSFGTFRRRLELGRSRLRNRLLRRGLAPAVLLAATPAAGASTVPATLATMTVRAVLDGAVSATVLSLVEKGLQTMLLTRTKLGLVLAIAVILGAGIVAHQALTAQPPPVKPDGRTVPSDPFASNAWEKAAQEIGGARPPADIEQRLADLEKRLEEALADVKAIRQAMKTSKGDATVFPLKNIQASLAAEVVRAAYPDGKLRITADQQTNSLIVQGSPADTAAVKRLLEALDSRKDGPETKTNLQSK